jgi:hypothetical protein
MKAFIAACAIGLCAVTAAEADTASNLPPREAGARYGQALGVALVCYGLRTTSALDRLPTTYTNNSRQAFQEEADKVLAAWREASTCRTAGGPNSCRLIHEWSCRDAILEIGPNGTKMPGLIEENHK